jgi:hypothetical protein
MSKIMDYHLHADGRIDIAVEINGEIYYGVVMKDEV